MSDPASIITRVVGQHRMGLGMTFYRDGTCKIPTCTCGESMHPNAYPAHLGEVAAQALGLIEDRRRITSPARGKPCDNCGHLKGLHGEPCLIITDRHHRACGCPSHVWTPPETDWEHRWITPWTPEEQK